MTTIKNKQFNRGRFALLANENENENEQVEEENLNNLVLNNYKKIKNINCDTNLKRKYHPQCARNNTNKKERIKKIKNFWEEYNQSINPNENVNEKKVRKRSNSFSDRFVFNKTLEFLNQKNTEVNRWMFNSFNYIKEPEQNRLKIKNLEVNNLTTRRQKLFRDMSDDERLIYIQQLFLPENWESNEGIHSIQLEVIELFRETEIGNKIQFNYDFEKIENSQNNNYFIYKINDLKRNPIILSIIPSYTIQKNKLNRITTELLKGEKSLKKIFGEELFNELNRIGILDDKSIDIYNKQYVRRNRDSAYAKLKIWVKTFFEKIEILEKILNLLDKNLLTKENVDKIFVDSILDVLGLYLFTCNYILREHFEERNKLLEWAYEGLYYNYMGILFDFIDNFLNCNDENIKQEFKNQKIGKGGFGNIFLSKNKKIILKEIQDINKKRFERLFLEFFKQVCLHTKKPEYIPNPYFFIFGDKKIYISMEYLEGFDLFKFYTNKIKNILNINMTNNELNKKKSKIVYDFFIIIANVLKDLQDDLSFIHNDLNMNNIIILEKNNIFNLKIIDFDYSVFKINDLYIFNYNKYTDITNIIYYNKINKKLELSNFSKSIDLIRIVSYFLFFGKYYYDKELKKIINGNENDLIQKFKNDKTIIIKNFDLNNNLIKKIKEEYFGIINNNFPEDLDIYFDKNPIIKKYLDFSPRVPFANIFFVRKKIFNEFINTIKENPRIIKNENIRTWSLKYYMWINNFIPLNFLTNLDNIISYF